MAPERGKVRAAQEELMVMASRMRRNDPTCERAIHATIMVPVIFESCLNEADARAFTLADLLNRKNRTGEGSGQHSIPRQALAGKSRSRLECEVGFHPMVTRHPVR
jgi:hypothetical protein